MRPSMCCCSSRSAASISGPYCAPSAPWDSCSSLWAPRPSSGWSMPSAKLTLWNRKLHYYLGLYFLFFLWLFAFTGLLLNHPAWTFAEFWTNRKQSVFERQIQTPRSGGDLDQARDLMRQLGIVGEIEWTATRSDPDTFDFRVTRPGHIFEIHADFNHRHAVVQSAGLNAWGVLHILHTFTGVRLADTRNQRDWA